MDVTILFFSGTGNTKWAAGSLADRLMARGHRVRVHDLEKGLPSDLGTSERIVLAHPIYGANLPRFVSDAVRHPGFPIDLPLDVLATFGYVNALGFFRERRALGLSIHSYYNLRMFNDVTTPSVHGKVLPTELRAARRPRIEASLDAIAKSMSDGERRIQGIGPYLLPGLVIGRLSRDGLRDNWKSLSVDPGRCARCLRCAKSCPSASIEATESGFRFLETCTACMRCYNSCPKQAILVDGEYADPSTFPRYHGPWAE